MSDSVEIQIAKKEYKLRSATGTYIAALGKGRISNTITMDEEKMTIQTKPEKKSTIPVLYYEDITDVRVTKKITGYYIFYMAVALLCCFAAPYGIVLLQLACAAEIRQCFIPVIKKMQKNLWLR